jgi:hypothetical protein
MDWNQPLKSDEDDARKENLDVKFLVCDVKKKGTKLYIVLKMIFL